MITSSCSIREGWRVVVAPVAPTNRLLKGVGKTLALTMVSLGIVSVPITFLNMANLTTALGLVRGSDLTTAFSTS